MHSPALIPERWRLSTRLLVLGLAAALVCTSLGGWLLREELHAVVLRSFEVQLRERAERVGADLEATRGSTTRQPSLEQGEFGRIFSGWYWVLQRPGGANTQSRSVWDASLDPRLATPLSGASGLQQLNGPRGEVLLGLVRPLSLPEGPAQLHVFGPMAETLSEWRRIDQILLLTQAGFLLALVAWTVLQVRMGLAPVRRLLQGLEAIGHGEATALGTQHYGPDLDPVAATLDDVLARNARVVERARDQAADLSHALKKPLAVLGLQARAEQVSGPWLQEQVVSMSHTIDRHLARFGSGAGSTQVVPVEPLLQKLLGLMRQIHSDRSLRWTLDAPADATWQGAASDLEEMAGNLLDNAGKWARSAVRVRVEVVGTAIEIRIEDDGPGMDADQRALATERGRRFDESVAGHGLGLGIVQDIAETYGGRLRLDTSPLGGLCCVLRLPQ